MVEQSLPTSICRTVPAYFKIRTEKENHVEHGAISKGSWLSLLPFRIEQVRLVDQTRYPKVTIESFVGHSSMGLLCPPVPKCKVENLMAENGLRQCKTAFEKRTANVLVLKSDSKGSNPRVSRGLHTHPHTHTHTPASHTQSAILQSPDMKKTHPILKPVGDPVGLLVYY